MRRLHYIFLILVLAVAGAAAQNKSTAQNKAAACKLFNEGRFEEAKPMFKQLLKGKPKSAEYNLWYAACCIETGTDSVNVLPMLELAASHDLPNAYRYLGEYYMKRRNYPAAVEAFDEYVGVVEGDKLLEAGYERLDYAKRLLRMVRNTEKVCFVDSFVVDKHDFLQVYKMGTDVGRLALASDYFKKPSMNGVVYESERGLDIYYSADNGDSEPLMKLYYNVRTGDDWGDPRLLEGFDTGGNDSYPFMLSDGTTFYFASDGEGSIGGYDIFVTSYNEEDGEFYRPTPLGMPFNSLANDYMLAINEVASIGWFASDRHQPEGKVCVYVFIPVEEKEKYDVDELGYEKVLAYADIASIMDTQTDEELIREARRRFTMSLYAGKGDGTGGDFLFVVDDIREYRSLSNFKSSEARDLYAKWLEASKVHALDVKSLEDMRDEYAKATKSAKARMKEQILSLEKKVEKEHGMLEQMLLKVRRLEHAELYK